MKYFNRIYIGEERNFIRRDSFVFQCSSIVNTLGYKWSARWSELWSELGYSSLLQCREQAWYLYEVDGSSGSFPTEIKVSWYFFNHGFTIYNFRVKGNTVWTELIINRFIIPSPESNWQSFCKIKHREICREVATLHNNGDVLLSQV